MVNAKEYLSRPLINLASKVVLANFIKPRVPFKATFALTYKCNSRCKYCNSWARPNRDELCLKDIKRILQTMPDIKWLHLTGGEIFLREDIAEILNFAIKSNGLAILTIPTNGIFSDKIVNIMKVLGKAKNIPRIFVTCSLDGTKSSYMKIRGVPNGYEKCLDTFVRLRQIGNICVYLSITLSTDNYHDIPLLLEELKKRVNGFSFSEIHFNFLNKSFFYNNNDSFHDHKKINQEIFGSVNKLRSKNRRRGFRYILEDTYFKLMPRFLENGKSPIPCNSLSGSIFIDPYADVYPCINFEKRLFNLKDNDCNFLDSWFSNHSTISEARNIIKNERCPGCWTPCEAYPNILTNLLRCGKT